jgi:UrcA family protein
MNVTTHNANLAARSAALFLTCMLVGTHAFAGEPDPVSSETVKYQDLNVDSPAGVTALYQRIHSAAKRVCDVGGDRNLASQQEAQTCASKAEAGAVAHVNSPALTAYYQMKTGRQVAVFAANRAE